MKNCVKATDKILQKYKGLRDEDRCFIDPLEQYNNNNNNNTNYYSDNNNNNNNYLSPQRNPLSSTNPISNNNNNNYLSPDRNNNLLQQTYNNNNYDTTHIESPSKQFFPPSPLDKSMLQQQQQQSPLQSLHQPISPNRFNFNNNIYLNEEMNKLNDELKELEMQEKELIRKKSIIDGIIYY